jgi:hypothetical protein
MFIVVPRLVVQTLLTGFGTSTKKGGTEEPPALSFAAMPQKHACIGCSLFTGGADRNASWEPTLPSRPRSAPAVIGPERSNL